MSYTEQKTIEPEQKMADPIDHTVTSSNGIIISEPDQNHTWIQNRGMLMLHGIVKMEGYTDDIKRNIKHIYNRSQLDTDYLDLLRDQIYNRATEESDPEMLMNNDALIALMKRIRIMRWSRLP